MSRLIVQPHCEPEAAAGPLTWHLQAVLEYGDEVRVGLGVVQLLLDQVKHGTRTLGVHVGLHAGNGRTR